MMETDSDGIGNNDEIFPRKSFIDAIDLSLFKYGVCVLRGDSGIGKSYVAEMYKKKAEKERKFKHIFVVNASNQNIQKSMEHMAQEMCLNYLDENSNPVTFEKIFKLLGENIASKKAANEALLIFDNAEEKFFMKCYDKAQNIKMLILTQRGKDYLTDIEEKGIIHLKPYDNLESLTAVKTFFDHHHLVLQDQGLYSYLIEILRGFPLAIYQALNEIKFRAAKEKKNIDMPVDELMKKFIDDGNQACNVDVIKEVEDPYLQIVCFIVKTSFERLSNHGGDRGRNARKLLLLMSYMDCSYLFKEMFDGDDTNEGYGVVLKVLVDSGIITYERR